MSFLVVVHQHVVFTLYTEVVHAFSSPYLLIKSWLRSKQDIFRIVVASRGRKMLLILLVSHALATSSSKLLIVSPFVSCLVR